MPGDSWATFPANSYSTKREKEVIMARRKRYIKGRVYYTNDSTLVNVKPKKRRVVAINNNPNMVHVKRILTANKGRNSIRGKPIEKYPDIPKQSVVENRTFRKTRSGKPIKASNMRKSATRFNKWDRKKIGIR